MVFAYIMILVNTNYILVNSNYVILQILHPLL